MVRFIVGITGGSGVGKTTLINLLYKEFKGRASTFSLDNYYLPKEAQQKDENGVINFDLPTALDAANLEKDIQLLTKGEQIRQAVYGFNNPQQEKAEQFIEPKELLIVEGLYVMYYPFLRTILDYSVYLMVEKELQLQRRLHRDMNERNYAAEDIIYQWQNHVLPSYKAHVEPFKDESDLIITNNEGFDDNIHILLAKIHEKLDLSFE
jgi:uridine kinase